MFSREKKEQEIEIMKSKLNMPKVKIHPEALLKMKGYIDACKYEVAWLGSVIKEGNTYIIDDVMIARQVADGSTCEITEQGNDELMLKMIQNGEDEKLNRVKVWGHSHVNMGVFASGQDKKELEAFGDTKLPDGGYMDYFIRIIGNKKGDMSVSVADYDKGIVVCNVDWSIYVEGEEEILDRCREEVKEMVTKKVAEKPKIPKDYNSKENEKVKRIRDQWESYFKKSKPKYEDKYSWESNGDYVNKGVFQDELYGFAEEQIDMDSYANSVDIMCEKPLKHLIEDYGISMADMGDIAHMISESNKDDAIEFVSALLNKNDFENFGSDIIALVSENKDEIIKGSIQGSRLHIISV